MDVERPEYSEFESVLRFDIVVCREIIRCRPIDEGICIFYKNTCPLPLDINKCIEIWSVAYQLFVLIVEYTKVRAVALCIIFRIILGVQADLHIHYLFHDIKLQVISEIK